MVSLIISYGISYHLPILDIHLGLYMFVYTADILASLVWFAQGEQLSNMKLMKVNISNLFEQACTRQWLKIDQVII